MTYASRETSRYSAEPYELFLFQTETKSWRMTSADREITYLGEIYEIAAITRTETEQGTELKSGSVKITIPKQHQLAGEFISFIPATPMSLVIYRGHQGDADVVTNFTGGVLRGDFPLDVCEMTVAPESQILKDRIPGPVYQKQCNHILYDLGCGVDKEDFRVSATLTFVNGTTIKATAFDAQPDGWFTGGYIEKGTERRMVISHVGDTLVLLNPMVGLAVSNVIDAYAGCQRDSETCVSKFDNLVHFLGFEWIPTRNPFRGGLE